MMLASKQGQGALPPEPPPKAEPLESIFKASDGPVALAGVQGTASPGLTYRPTPHDP